MARNNFTDECGRRTLGIVQVAITVPPAAARPGPDFGAAHVEATDWAVSWSDVPADRAGGAVGAGAAAAGVVGVRAAATR